MKFYKNYPDPIGTKVVENIDESNAKPGTFIVTYTVTEDLGDGLYSLSADHTKDEIAKAIADGKEPVAKVVADGATAYAFATIRRAPDVMMYTGIVKLDDNVLYVEVFDGHDVDEGTTVWRYLRMIPLAIAKPRL